MKVKIKKRLISAAATLSLVVAVGICITVIAQTLSQGYVSLFGTSMFRVVTGSMEPEIPIGSLLISKETEMETLEIGDIVCFRSKESAMLGQVITHRITDIVQGEDGKIYLETRGDANPSVDGYYVTEENLIGEAVYYTKEGNIVAGFISVLTSKVGFLALIVFPVILIAGFIMKDSVKSIRRELDAMQREIAQVQEKEQKKLTLEELLTPEEYAELLERLKTEILEEVKQSVEVLEKDESSDN